MQSLKFVGEGSFELHIESRIIPIQAGTVVDNVPEAVVKDLLSRKVAGKATWEAVSGPPKNASKDTPKAEVPAQPK